MDNSYFEFRIFKSAIRIPKSEIIYLLSSVLCRLSSYFLLHALSSMLYAPSLTRCTGWDIA